MQHRSYIKGVPDAPGGENCGMPQIKNISRVGPRSDSVTASLNHYVLCPLRCIHCIFSPPPVGVNRPVSMNPSVDTNPPAGTNRSVGTNPPVGTNLSSLAPPALPGGQAPSSLPSVPLRRPYRALLSLFGERVNYWARSELPGVVQDISTAAA